MRMRRIYLYVWVVLIAAFFPGCRQTDAPIAADAPERLLVFGMDAVGWDVLRPLCEAGHLPTMDRLIRNGSAARLKTLYPTVSVMLWTTIATGMLPENHGISNWLSEGADSSGQLAITSNLRRVPALWNLGESTRFLVANWWATWPAEDINGTLISNRAHFPDLARIMTPENQASELAQIARPERAELEKEISELNPYRHPIRLPEFQFRQLQTDRFYLDCTNHWLRQGNVDIAAVFIRGIDILEHEYLKDVLPDAPGPDIPPDQHGLVISYYRYLDRYLQRLIETMGDRCAVLIVSDHGMEPVTQLPPYIEGLDLNALLQKTGIGFGSGNPAEPQPAIRDNKRYPPGLVRGLSMHSEKGADHLADIQQTLIGQLSEITVDGQPFFEQIQKGDTMSEIVHLTMRSNPAIQSTVRYRDLEFPLASVVKMILHPRSGQHWHSPPGIFILSGPGVASNPDLQEIRIQDIMPTGAALMRLPIAKNLDGAPQTTFFTGAFRSRYPVEWVDAYPWQPMEGVIPSAPEVDSSIRKELQSLGYIQ